MSEATVVLVFLGLGTYALKAAGPLLLGGRVLPRWVLRLAELAPAALLAALVATSTFALGDRLTFDARLVGLVAAAVALKLKAPFVVVVVIAAAATAVTRSLA
ncbi:MAG: AzlD domain-containing protein [Acidimicrobiia bacterium]